MRDITVTYNLTDEHEERLKAIQEEYKKNNIEMSEDKIFESIMLIGSWNDIDEKFKFHEWKLGLRDNFK